VLEAGMAPDQLGDDDPDLAARPVVGTPRSASGNRHADREHRKLVHSVALVVFAVGVAIAGTLAFTARALHDSNENRLLRQRVAEAGTVLSASIPNIQSPLSSAAVLAEATHADRAAITNLLTPLVNGHPFVSASVWPARAANPRPEFVIGVPPALAQLPAEQIRARLNAAPGKTTMSVIDLLGQKDRRLGYLFSVNADAKYVVYGEAQFPANRRARIESNSAFADLDYAIYIGSTSDADHLIAASSVDPRFTGRRTASDRVPFGDTTLELVMAPRRQLGGDLLARLPWFIGGIGAVIALAGALMTERLVRRRTHAEFLARQNARLFSEQRGVAQTLQHALLPDELPAFAGIDLAVRYVPGVDGVDIGGDWYDVIGVADGQVLFVVGDVSGRGLRAATIMASLRYGIRAYAAQGDAPSTILFKLTKLIDIVRDGHFATVLCGLVDVGERRATFANAGHPNPLLIDGSGAAFVPTRVGPPVGVATGEYESVSVSIPPNGTLLAYTDGLFERRRENPDVGLERLRAAAVGERPLDALLDDLFDAMTPDGAHDDTAILALRLRN
jgi:serine phosphatase RsbU (regulator of sigma subunit)